MCRQTAKAQASHTVMTAIERGLMMSRPGLLRDLNAFQRFKREEFHKNKDKLMSDMDRFIEGFTDPNCEVCDGSGFEEQIRFDNKSWFGVVVGSNPENLFQYGDMVVIRTESEPGKVFYWNFWREFGIEDMNSTILFHDGPDSIAIEATQNVSATRRALVFCREDQHIVAQIPGKYFTHGRCEQLVHA